MHFNQRKKSLAGLQNIKQLKIKEIEKLYSWKQLANQNERFDSFKPEEKRFINSTKIQEQIEDLRKEIDDVTIKIDELKLSLNHRNK